MLEDTQTTGTECEEREPLHDNEVDEVDGRSFCEAGAGKIGVDAVGERAVFEPEIAEGDAFTLQVPVGHGEGGEGFDDADETVGLEH